MLPGPLKDAVDVWTWKRCYSMQEVNSALSKVQLVGYSQKVVRTPLSPTLSAQPYRNTDTETNVSQQLVQPIRLDSTM